MKRRKNERSKEEERSLAVMQRTMTKPKMEKESRRILQMVMASRKTQQTVMVRSRKRKKQMVMEMPKKKIQKFSSIRLN